MQTSLIGKQQDSANHADIGENRDGLTELDLFQFLSPTLCTSVHINC